MAGLKDLSEEGVIALRSLIATDPNPQPLAPGSGEPLRLGLLELQRMDLADKMKDGKWVLTAAGEQVAMEFYQPKNGMFGSWKPSRRS